MPYFREDLLYEGIKEQESVTFLANRITYFWREDGREGREFVDGLDGWMGGRKKNFVIVMMEIMRW